MRFTKPQSWEEWVFQGFLLLAAFFAVAHAIFKEFPEWPLVVTIFLGIYFLLQKLHELRKVPEAVAQVANNLLKLHDEIVPLAEHELDVLTKVAKATHLMDLRFESYSSAGEFYPALKSAVENARRRVDATYIRRFPWSESDNEKAEKYFDSSVEWSKKSSDRILRRIMVDNNEMMNKWIVRYLDTTEVREAKHYHVRILPWRIEADLVNFALIDNETVFVAFSGENKELEGGFSFRHKEIAKFLEVYYQQLWNASDPSDGWRNSKMRPAEQRPRRTGYSGSE
jgi:hypothetical protein